MMKNWPDYQPFSSKCCIKTFAITDDWWEWISPYCSIFLLALDLKQTGKYSCPLSPWTLWFVIECSVLPSDSFGYKTATLAKDDPKATYFIIFHTVGRWRKICIPFGWYVFWSNSYLIETNSKNGFSTLRIFFSSIVGSIFFFLMLSFPNLSTCPFGISFRSFSLLDVKNLRIHFQTW